MNGIKGLQIFNRYREVAGEEASVNRIFEYLSSRIEMDRLLFSSQDWIDRDLSKVFQAARTLYNPEAIAALRAKHSQFHPDFWMVHNPFPVASGGVFREAIRQNIPIIYYIHNFRPFSVNGTLWAGNELVRDGLHRNFFPEIRRASWQDSYAKTACLGAVLTLMHRLKWFRSVRAWIAISEFMRDRLVEAGVRPEDVFVLRHFWDFKMAVPEEPVADDSYLFIGRLILEKGVLSLLEAWVILREKLGSRCPRLVIAGMGSLEQHVKRAAASNPRIEFLGYTAGVEKRQLFMRCRAVLAPSVWWEPLGLMVYEAYDYSKPVIAASSGGLIETVQHGRTGLVHIPGSAASLAEQVIRLESNAQERRQFGEAGRKWLETNAGSALWWQKFEKVLTHVMSQDR